MQQANYMTLEERIIQRLRNLYSRYGYSRFRINRFEEYDIYTRNKDFLVGDRMISFTDINGKLMALKPDVTISVIKSGADGQRGVRKLYYNENVYRAGAGDASFREILQTGLECMGAVSDYDICEVIALAARSLELISPDWVLDISHLGYVSGLMAHAGVPEEMYSQVLRYVREKNAGDLGALCIKLGISEEGRRLLLTLARTEQGLAPALDALAPLSFNEDTDSALRQLRSVYEVLAALGLDGRCRLDFSVVNDMNYYNGIVFQGFVKGLPAGVLSGGQYDRLVRRMGKSFRAIGFAVYLDELARLEPPSGGGVDVLLVCPEGVSPALAARRAQEIADSGRSVLVAAGQAPAAGRWKEMIVLDGGDR